MDKNLLDVTLEELKNSIEQCDFEGVWKSIDDGMPMSSYRQETHKIINEVRDIYNAPPIDDYEYDKGWQYLTLASEEYEVALTHMIHMIYQCY